MATLDLGRVIEHRNGSQDPLLSSVKPIIEDFKVSGKVDDKAINVLFDAIKALQKNLAEFLILLASENNDAIVMKLKSVILKLTDFLSEQDLTDLALDIAGQLENKQEKEDLVKYINDNKSDKTSDENSNKNSDETSNETVGEYEDATIAENFNTLLTLIKNQFDLLKKNFTPKSFKTLLGGFLFAPFKKIGEKLKKFKLPKFKLPKFKLPKFKLPKFKLPKFKLPKLFGRSKSAKEKKAEKRQNSIFDSLEKLVKRFKKFANNTKAAVLSFLKDIIIPVAKIVASAIGIILKPVMSFLMGFFWGSGIAILLIAIAAGIFLIGLAINKLVDWVVDDLGPEIERWMSVMEPEAINSFMTSVSNFINTFSALIAGLFAPIIAIGTVVMAAIEPIGEFVKEMLTSLKNHLMPIIDTIFDIISNVVIKILRIIELIIMKIIDIVGGVILTILEAIEPIINAIKPLIMVISDIITGVILGAVMVIEGIVKLVNAAILYVRDHWDEFVTFVKSLPSKILEFIKSIPSMVMNLFKKVLDIGRFVLNKIKGAAAPLAEKKFKIWKWEIQPFGFLANKDSSNEVDGDKLEVKQEQDIEKIESAAKTATEALEENKDKEKKLTLEDFKADITKFLTEFRDITLKNFEEISKKLDEPQVVPLPLMSLLINPTLQENRY